MPFSMPLRPTFRVRPADHAHAVCIADHLQRRGQPVSPSEVIRAALAIAADRAQAEASGPQDGA